MIRRMLLCGATGDLARRYLYPALAALSAAGHLPDGFALTGCARKKLDDDSFRELVRDALAEHGKDVSDRARDAVLAACRFRPVDLSKPETVPPDLLGDPAPTLAYLALPPAVYDRAVAGLARLGLPPGSGAVLEKPFGTDRASASALNAVLRALFAEDRIFRMDHFLGKPAVQNLLGLRFANRLFEPAWNRGHVARVTITWDEALALEGRAGFYDATGALCDMIQSHLLQLLALVAMERPRSFAAKDLRDAKVAALKAVRTPSRRDVARDSARGRYTAGRVDGHAVPSYVDEPGVEASRGTETFAQVTLFVDNDRWAGVPFVLRSGKALGEERREVGLELQTARYGAFDGTDRPAPDRLRIAFKPDRIALELNLNGPGDPFDLERATLAAALSPHELPDHARLLRDALAGDPTLSVRGDEAEEAWRIVDPIRAAWRDGAVPLGEYPAGSAGPAQVAASSAS